MNNILETRKNCAIETIEYYMFQKYENKKVLNNAQKLQISDLIPLLDNKWANEAIQLIQ
jgi:hypothetical protein